MYGIHFIRIPLYGIHKKLILRNEYKVTTNANRDTIMRRRDQYFCQMALEEARKSYMNQKHGCVIIHNDKEVVAQGFNHDLCTMNDVNSIHAEVSAINQLRKILKTNKDKNFVQRCKLYVVRVGSPVMNYPMKNSKPCEHCTKSIFKMGIPTVYYSTDDEYLEVLQGCDGNGNPMKRRPISC